ncbi:MAG TPA: ribosomal L7Ae/L30e/S12e/Gadd45 family protein [Limnochordia bacterium]
MPERLRQARARAVGSKQTAKAIQAGTARIVFLAKDADESVTRPIRELAEKHRVDVVYVDTMQGLGRACNIEVGAAAAAVIDDG